MTKLYVTEYAADGRQQGVALVQAPLEPPLAEQVVDYTAGVAASSAFNAATTIVRLHADSICSVEFGTSPTATVTKRRLAAGVTEFVCVPQGLPFKVSAITNT